MLTLDPPRQTRAPVVFQAQVAERWMVTARMHPRRFRELVPAPFLEPLLRQGSLVVSLCCVNLRRAAPAWLPLEQGTGGQICALRLACRDRDGSPCAWIARRHTDPVLAAAMRAAGLPQVDGGLSGLCGSDRLDLRADDGLVECSVAPGHGHAPVLFADAAEAGSVLMEPRRSYSLAADGRWVGVELQRQGGGACELRAGWEGWLRTPWGDCTIDAVYRMSGGLFSWMIADGAGHD